MLTSWFSYTLIDITHTPNIVLSCTGLLAVIFNMAMLIDNFLEILYSSSVCVSNGKISLLIKWIQTSQAAVH